jgi:hypothetical protein
VWWILYNLGSAIFRCGRRMHERACVHAQAGYPEETITEQHPTTELWEAATEIVGVTVRLSPLLLYTNIVFLCRDWLVWLATLCNICRHCHLTTSILTLLSTNISRCTRVNYRTFLRKLGKRDMIMKGHTQPVDESTLLYRVLLCLNPACYCRY